VEDKFRGLETLRYGESPLRRARQRVAQIPSSEVLVRARKARETRATMGAWDLTKSLDRAPHSASEALFGKPEAERKGTSGSVHPPFPFSKKKGPHHSVRRLSLPKNHM